MQTNSEKQLANLHADYARWYGTTSEPKEVCVEVEEKDGLRLIVDIAFDGNFSEHLHYDRVSGWDDLKAHTLHGAKRKFGYRIVEFLDYTALRPIVYVGKS